MPEEFVTAVKDTGVFTPVYLEDKLCIFARLDRLGIPAVSFKIQIRAKLQPEQSCLAQEAVGRRTWGREVSQCLSAR